VEFARSIIRRPSVTRQEGELGRFLAASLEEKGLQVDMQEVAPDRYNVMAVLPGADSTLGLLFHAHMDTIAAGAMEDPYSARVADGHIWGRGSVDQKGGLAAAVMALAAIAKQNLPLKCSLGLALVVDEESEHRGSMFLAQHGLPCRQAVVTEPSGLRLVIGCKGTVPFRIQVKGKTAHGARPWLGLNAIHQAMRVAQELESLEHRPVTVSDYGPVRGSLNLGVVEGGRAYNIVPDECRLWYDRRTVPGETQGSVLQEVQAVLDRLSVGEPPVHSTLTIDRPDWDWDPIRERGLLPSLTPPEASIRALVARHHAAVLGSPVDVYFTDGYNEMDFLMNDMGIPTVQYGPGDSQLCHTDQERLKITQLVDATRVYVRLALEAAT
jgi:acetylornithine deacetylase/succinyl-diaminopimelate desuccinylase family protein